MTRKKDTGGKQIRKAERGSWDPETYKYYFPILALVLFAAVVLLFGEFIFSDQMLHGSDTINAGIFFRHFYVDYVNTHGAVPVWNPYIFGGLPFIDAFHGDIFYPFSVLKFFGNFYRMLGINLVLHIFLAGIFMYFTARQFRLSRVASTLSAVAYMFSGYLVSLVAPGHDGKIFVTTLFPLTILFLDRAFERKPVLNFSLLGLVIGIIILSPHPQLSYYALWAIAFYGVFKLVNLYRQCRSVTALVKPSGLFVGAIIIGLLISAVQFYPGYVYTTKYSPRADTKRGYDWATSWSMHEEEAFSLVVPEFAGNNSGEQNFYWGKNAFKDNSEYAGVIPLFLAFIALFFYRRKEAIFFGGLALFALIYALGGTTPIFRIFFYLIPNVKSLRAPSTIMFIFLFSVSLLAGMAVQYLIERGRQLSAVTKKKLTIYLAAIPAAFLVFALLFAVAGESILSLYSSIFYSGIQTPIPGQGGMTKWRLALMNLPGLQHGIWIVFLFSAAAAGAVLIYLYRRAGIMMLMALPLLTMVDGIRYDGRFISTYDYRQQVTPDEMTKYLKSLPGKFRVFNLNAVRQDDLPFHGIEVVTGYHGNQLRWYDELLGGPGMTNLANPNFINMVGAKFILAQAATQIPPNYFGQKPLTKEKDFGNLALYRNDNALPRAFLVNRYEVIPDRKDIFPRILSGQSDMRRMVFLEENPPLAINSGDSLLASAEMAAYSGDSIVIRVNPAANCLLVLADNYYPAWEAWVDGVKTTVLRADGAFRAVPIKAGVSQVIFKYNRSFNNRARMITIIGLLIVAVVLGGNLYNNMKAKRKTTIPV